MKWHIRRFEYLIAFCILVQITYLEKFTFSCESLFDLLQRSFIDTESIVWKLMELEANEFGSNPFKTSWCHSLFWCISLIKLLIHFMKLAICKLTCHIFSIVLSWFSSYSWNDEHVFNSYVVRNKHHLLQHSFSTKWDFRTERQIYSKYFSCKDVYFWS